MKTIKVMSTALICSIIVSGCATNDMRRSARSQSYHNMGNQGYHISPGENSASTQNITGQSNLYNVSSEKLTGDFDINRSHQLEAKLNRAGITTYSVLVAGNHIFLAHAYPAPQRTLNNGASSTIQADSATSLDTGLGSTAGLTSTPTSQTGFGTPSSPGVNKQSNQPNGVPIDELERNNTTQNINQNVNKANQIPINPSYTNNGGDSRGDSREMNEVKRVVEEQIGKNTQVFFIHDQAGVNAIASIKQKANKKGTSQEASIDQETRILEAEINR